MDVPQILLDEDFSGGQFAKANPTPVRPEPVEGLPFPFAAENQCRNSTIPDRIRDRTEVEAAEAGMAEMSKRFHDEGGELYVPAAE